MLALFALAGKYILAYFGISYPALKIAGGILIGLVGFEMTRVGEKPRTQVERRVSVDRALSEAFVPLGSPLLVGPGAISLSILSEASYGLIPTIISSVIAALMAFPFIYFSSSLGRLLGERGVRVLTRVLGIFILAIGIQYILDGLAAFMYSKPRSSL
jgi:multiple antibiotic resistance protein